MSVGRRRLDRPAQIGAELRIFRHADKKALERKGGYTLHLKAAPAQRDGEDQASRPAAKPPERTAAAIVESKALRHGVSMPR